MLGLLWASNRRLAFILSLEPDKFPPMCSFPIEGLGEKMKRGAGFRCVSSCWRKRLYSRSPTSACSLIGRSEMGEPAGRENMYLLLLLLYLLERATHSWEQNWLMMPVAVMELVKLVGSFPLSTYEEILSQGKQHRVTPSVFCYICVDLGCLLLKSQKFLSELEKCALQGENPVGE